MPKLKADEVDIDVRELDEAEYNEDEFADYTGDIPKAGTVLTAYVRKMWYTYTNPKPDRPEGDPMLKVLIVAADNTGRLEQYNGLPMWDNMALTAQSKWKWAPFLRVFGLTIRDVKTKTYVEDDDDPRNGAPITKISNWQVGEDHDEAWCRVITKKGKSLDGEDRAEIRKILEYEEPEPDEDADDDEAEEVVEEDVDEVDEPDPDDEQVDEPEDDTPDEQAPPARGRGRAAATATRAAPTRTAGKAPATRSSAGTASKATRSAPATRTAATGRTAKAAAAPARGRGRRGANAGGSADDPPF